MRKVITGPGAAYLGRAIQEAERKPNGGWARTIAELGIGTNPMARLQGNVMTDENAAGTIHVAIGRNDMFGGENPTLLHVDCVVSGPTLHVYGEMLDLPDRA